MAEGRPEHEDIVSWSTRQNFYGKLPATIVPAAGRYRIRLSVQAVHPPPDDRVWCSIQTGFINAKASTMYWVGSFEATSEKREYEFEAWIGEGHMLRVLPNDRGLKQVPIQLVGEPAGTVEPLGFPGVAIKWIEMQRIVPDRAKLRQALIGDLELRPITAKTKEITAPTDVLGVVKPDEVTYWQEGPDERFENERFETARFEIVSENPEQDLRELVQSFAQRAFRRPVTQKEILPYLNFALKRLEADGSGIRPGGVGIGLIPSTLRWNQQRAGIPCPEPVPGEIGSRL